MAIFNILKANNKVKEQEAMLTEWSTKYEAKCLELVELQKDFEKQMAAFADVDKTLKDMQAKNETDINTLRKQYEDIIALKDKEITETKISTGNKAIDLVSSIGIPVAELPVETDKALNENDIFSKFQTLSGKEAIEFYNKYRTLIIKASGIKQ